MPVKHKTKARRKTIKPIKIAYHFNADHPTMTGFYGHKVEDFVFRVLLNRRSLNISSKVLTGDLLLDVLASETEESGGYKARKFSSDQYQQVVQLWLEPNNTPWSNVLHGRLESALCGNIFTICFETVDAELAGYVDKKFIEGFEPYLGALEVDESSHVHWWLYSNSIGPRYRVNNRNVSIFWDGVSEQPKDQGLVNWLKEIGFREVGFESLNGRYTIFDEYHSFEQARRVAEWKKQCGNLLAFIADEVAHKLGDAAPELGDKLWAMLKTFNEAETNEQFAQVTASCRRIVEYVSDQLFPPLNDEVEGRKLGVKQYRNRLLAFVDEERKSNTNIDLVWISTKTLSEQIEKLTSLANKGVHAEVYRAETRRCLLRTIMLLDDVASLRVGSFEIRIKLDFGDCLDFLSEDITLPTD